MSTVCLCGVDFAKPFVERRVNVPNEKDLHGVPRLFVNVSFSYSHKCFVYIHHLPFGCTPPCLESSDWA